MSSLDGNPALWGRLLDEFGQSQACHASVASYLERFRTTDPFEVTGALEPDLAKAHKPQLTAFVLGAIRIALLDHELTDREVEALRHIARLLRIEEGDLIAHYPDVVSEVIGLELQRLLEDGSIDIGEAIHKAKLQEVFGLGYDEFVRLTAPQIELVLVTLLRRLGAGPACYESRVLQCHARRCGRAHARGPGYRRRAAGHRVMFAIKRATVEEVDRIRHVARDSC